jgi:hypothetical protein
MQSIVVYKTLRGNIDMRLRAREATDWPKRWGNTYTAFMPDDDREMLQRFLDNLFRENKRVSRLEVIVRAETLDLGSELMPIIENLPSGSAYTRTRLADQLNSAIVGHGWSRRYGTVD